MRVRLQRSAPGKLVLLGEYAVLFGHPSLVMAVNRRARVELRPSEDGRWSSTAPGYADSPVFFDITCDRGLRWAAETADRAGRFELLEGVLTRLASAGLIDPGTLEPASVVLDTREFFRNTPAGPVKLGLGSSAALTVALASAAMAWGGADDPGTPEPERLRRAIELHRSFQRGRGSGVDVAASLMGGVVEYRLDDNGAVAVARTVELPRDLRLVPVWTGRPAATSVFLARLARRVGDETGAVVAVLAELGRAAESGIDNLRGGNLPGALADVDRFAEAMEELGRAAGLDILSAEHRQLGRLAHRVGVRYKPSGAGGGDFGIGWSDDPAAAAAFVSAAADAGFPTPALAPECTGLGSC
jgi:phosphomevalonate kinase